MKRFLGLGFVVAAVAAAGAARAQSATTNPNYVFTTIDAVLRQSDNRLFLTGVLEGASEPTQVLLNIYGPSPSNPGEFARELDSCERAALLLMNKPGQYRLEAWVSYSSSYSYCRLSRVNP